MTELCLTRPVSISWTHYNNIEIFLDCQHFNFVFEGIQSCAKNVACGLSCISIQPSVVYLVLVTLISHGLRCGTDFFDSELTYRGITRLCMHWYVHMDKHNGNPDLVCENKNSRMSSNGRFLGPGLIQSTKAIIDQYRFSTVSIISVPYHAKWRFYFFIAKHSNLIICNSRNSSFLATRNC